MDVMQLWIPSAGEPDRPAADVFRPRLYDGAVARPELVEAVVDAVRDAAVAHYDPVHEAARFASVGPAVPAGVWTE